MKRMELVMLGGVWHTWETGEGEELLRELCGTTILATAYFEAMPRHEVVERLKKLNPEYAIN